MWDEHNQPFNSYLKEYAKARMNSYLKELESSYQGAGNALFKPGELDKLAKEVGSVATGRDNPPKIKKPTFRNLDDDWQS